MANQQYLMASLLSAFYNISNDAVREELHKAKAALYISLKYEDQKYTNKFFGHLNEAQRLIKASLPTDYTPKNSVVADEPWYDAAPFAQQVDVEDYLILPRVYVDSEDVIENRLLGCAGSAKNSKSKAKWSRSGKTARVLSNR